MFLIIWQMFYLYDIIYYALLTDTHSRPSMDANTNVQCSLEDWPNTIAACVAIAMTNLWSGGQELVN